jgi:hypothetical protein
MLSEDKAGSTAGSNMVWTSPTDHDPEPDQAENLKTRLNFSVRFLRNSVPLELSSIMLLVTKIHQT